MSRLVFSALFAFSLATFSLTVTGCGTPKNEVIEDTRSQADIEQEEADYEAQMEESGDDVTE